MAHAEVCPVCNGAGVIQPVNTYNPQSTAVAQPETCHGCGGCGWVTVYGDEGKQYSYYPYFKSTIEIKSAKIVNVEGWSEGTWHEKMEGQVIKVKKYPYQMTKGSYTTYCNCAECRANRAGKELVDAYEVVEGFRSPGSIIPILCLEFI